MPASVILVTIQVPAYPDMTPLCSKSHAAQHCATNHHLTYWLTMTIRLVLWQFKVCQRPTCRCPYAEQISHLASYPLRPTEEFPSTNAQKAFSPLTESASQSLYSRKSVPSPNKEVLAGQVPGSKLHSSRHRASCNKAQRQWRIESHSIMDTKRRVDDSQA